MTDVVSGSPQEALTGLPAANSLTIGAELVFAAVG
jgi:hypothetical protein